MNLSTMALHVAENLGLLASNGVDVNNSRVTLEGIKNRLNDIYVEELFPLFSDKYPADFLNHTYPQDTYTSAGTISNVSTGTTLVSDSSTFDNSMEGFEIEDITDGSKYTIVTYISPTSVTIDQVITNASFGNSFVVLGNKYIFGGYATDLKEVIQVRIKYRSTDPNWTVCERVDLNKAIAFGSEKFGKHAPKFYLDSLLIDDIIKPAIGLLPYPDSYLGSFEIDYTARPARLSDSDEPLLSVQGISEVMVSGATAWGFRIMREYDAAREYQMMYDGNQNSKVPIGKVGLIQNYKPKTRVGAYRLRESRYVQGLRDRSF